MVISKSNVLFFSVILVAGILTMATDLRTKKIYNHHLAAGALLGLAAAVYASIWDHENILYHFINAATAFIAGFILHRIRLWKGGDAKLFTLYAFLMPARQGHPAFFSNAVELFCCSFIAGAAILMPVFIRDLASNYRAVAASKKFQTLGAAVRITVICSWVLYPVYYLASMLRFPAMSLIITYMIFYMARRFQVSKEADYKMIAYITVFGGLVRYYLNPGSLSWPALPISIFKIGLFAAISACIYATLDHLKEYNDRVPFAPLLFTGCILVYTPFLTWIMHLLNR